jgi:hypothetical protein
MRKAMSDDEEIMFNFLVFKFWGTDKEMEEAAPMMGCFVVLIIVALILYFCYNVTFGETEHLKAEQETESDR